MNTETGEIFSKEQHEEINKLIRQGQPIVPVSEKVARQQRIGQSRIRQQRKRQRQARRANR